MDLDEYMKFHDTDLDVCMQLTELQSMWAQMSENRTRTSMFFLLFMQLSGTVGMLFTNKPAVMATGIPSVAMLGLIAMWTESSPVNMTWKNVGYYCIMRNIKEIYNHDEEIAVLTNYRKGYTEQKWRSLLQSYYDEENTYVTTPVYTLAMRIINIMRLSY